MNLLFLTPQLPYPPRQGTAIRNWGLIHHLSRAHTVTLLSFQEADQPPPGDELLAAARVVTVPAPTRTRADRVRTLLTSAPDLAERRWSLAFRHALTQLLRDGDFAVAHVEGLEMAPYLAALHTAPGLSVVYDAHNVEHQLQQSAFATDARQPARWPAAAYSWLQGPRLKRFEADVCRAADAVTCVSNEDAAALRALVPDLHPTLVPNGIDVADYVVFAERIGMHPPAPQQPPSVVFTGKMDYRPNVDAVVWFASEIWPRLRAARPGAQFLVVGQKPAPAVQALHGRAGIVVTGAVDDTRPYLAQAAVYVAPLRMGGGTRFKLLEALALGRPVVSTTLGAEGFAVQTGRELVIADRPAEFAEAVAALLSNPARGQALAQAGRTFVAAHYDWSVIIPALESVYGRLANHRRDPAER